MKKQIWFMLWFILLWISISFASQTKQTLKEIILEESMKVQPVRLINTNMNENEEQKSYELLKEQWITNSETIEKSRLNDKITRAELSKILVLFKTKLIDKEIKKEELNTCSEYQDTQHIFWDLKPYIQFSCNLWIMWVWSDWKTQLEKFNPNWLVTRAELSTVISRMLYWKEFENEWWEYWLKHLAKLHSEWILTNLDYTITETRKNVFLILYRIYSIKN